MAHDHDHPHGHDHAKAHQRIGLAFALNLAFTVVEVIGAWWTQSSAVLSGALHDVGDCLVLGAAWYLQHVSVRGRDASYSYGYGRFSMLGGWFAGIILIIGSIGIIALSVMRMGDQVEPRSLGMIAVAAFGLVMNFLAVAALRGGTSLNERGARLHLLEDVLSWAAVLIAGGLLYFTDLRWIDPALSIGIALFILYNAVGMLRQGTSVLMQAQPAGVDEPGINIKALRALPDVLGTHDQHTWTLDGHYTVLTVHVVVGTDDPGRIMRVKQDARKVLDVLGVHHATIEIERPGEECGLQYH